MAAFLYQWLNIAENLVDQLPDATMAGLLLERIKHSIELKSDIDQYHRYGPSHRDHTYQFLIGAIQRRVNLARKDANRDREMEAIERSVKGPVGAAGCEEPGRNKNKNKKAKKDKDKEEGERERGIAGRGSAERRRRTRT